MATPNPVCDPDPDPDLNLDPTSTPTPTPNSDLDSDSVGLPPAAAMPAAAVRCASALIFQHRELESQQCVSISWSNPRAVAAMVLIHSRAVNFRTFCTPWKSEALTMLRMLKSGMLCLEKSGLTRSMWLRMRSILACEESAVQCRRRG